MFKDLVGKVIANIDLTPSEAKDAICCIVDGNATNSQIGAFLTALKIKGETIDEITAFAKVMRDNATFVNTKGETVVDVCGTGGDGKGTFNISTVVSFVLAGAGVKVAKHGNRASSSSCGSADVLKLLGVNIDATVNTVEKCIEEANIGFLFAPGLHRSMKNVALIRKELGIRTIFNLLGPITNPAGVKHQVVGVYSENLTETIASVLKNLGSKHALVVHGTDGMDEISISDKTKVSELVNGKIKNYYISPEDFNMSGKSISELIVETPEKSASAVKDVLKGEMGAKRDIVLLNAAAGFVASDVAGDLREGIQLAVRSIESGKALSALTNLINISCA
ncbi:MAG: anthranilate phosphoribosyltransferase [Candidatus Anammoxibacter sp.]